MGTLAHIIAPAVADELWPSSHFSPQLQCNNLQYEACRGKECANDGTLNDQGGRNEKVVYYLCLSRFSIRLLNTGAITEPIGCVTGIR
jgi:hypothetical protein